jgi:hypothetical protein
VCHHISNAVYQLLGGVYSKRPIRDQTKVLLGVPFKIEKTAIESIDGGLNMIL